MIDDAIKTSKKVRIELLFSVKQINYNNTSNEQLL